MPGFTIMEGRHFITLVTGPAHVLLGIRFSAQPSTAEPALIAWPARDGTAVAALDATRIGAAVAQALAAQRAAGNAVFADEIVYVEDDPPRYDLYRIAAERLVAHYLAGGGFRHAQ